MGTRPYATTVLACAKASRNQSGFITVANSAINNAPPANRAVTAAVGLQPASISDLPRGPDNPNVKADPTANSSPRRKWSTVAGRGSSCAVTMPPPACMKCNVMSKIVVGHDATDEGGHESIDF